VGEEPAREPLVLDTDQHSSGGGRCVLVEPRCEDADSARITLLVRRRKSLYGYSNASGFPNRTSRECLIHWTPVILYRSYRRHLVQMTSEDDVHALMLDGDRCWHGLAVALVLAIVSGVALMAAGSIDQALAIQDKPILWLFHGPGVADIAEDA